MIVAEGMTPPPKPRRGAISYHPYGVIWNDFFNNHSIYNPVTHSGLLKSFYTINGLLCRRHLMKIETPMSFLFFAQRALTLNANVENICHLGFPCRRYGMIVAEGIAHPTYPFRNSRFSMLKA